MKKVLLISKNSCYPLNHGGALAQYYFIDGLKDRVQFVFCTEISSENERLQIEELKIKQPYLKVYYHDATQPQRSLSKTKKIKRFILRAQQALFKNEIRKTIQDLNADDFNDPYFWNVDNKFSSEFISLIHSVIEKEKTEQVQFDFYNTIDLCFALPTHVKKIFIHHEVRFKRLQLAASMSKLPEAYKNYLIAKTEKFEKLCIQQMDEVVVFNEDDAMLLRDDCKNITVSPFAIPDELIFKQEVSNSFTKLLFVGGESHTPNLLGLMWFLDEIFLPQVNEIKLPLWIVGYWSDELKEKYKPYQQVVFCGMVDSLEPYFENSIFVNPILTGAGLRTKVLHAFVNKVPVLSTRFGAEGCFDKLNMDHLGLFDTGQELLQLLDSVDFIKLGTGGFNYYKKALDKEKLLNIRYKILN